MFAACVVPGDEAWCALAQRQDGLITRRQALAAGLSEGRLDRRIARGSWQVVLAGSYATFTGPLGRRHRARAALLYAGPEAVLGGATACQLYGLRNAAPARIEVLVPAQVRAFRGATASPRGRARMGLAEVRLRRTTRPIKRAFRDGLALVAIERAVVDAGRDSRTVRDARALLAEAVQRRFTTVDALEVELTAGPSAGSRLLRQVLGELGGGVRSAPEAELKVLMESSRVLPAATYNGPPIQVWVGGRAASFVPDATLAGAMLLVDCDSRQHHSSLADYEATMWRHSQLEALGYSVLHLAPAQIRSDPAGTLRLIEQTYVRRMVQLKGGPGPAWVDADPTQGVGGRPPPRGRG